MRIAFSHTLILVLVAALFGGCTILVDGQEEGRPCKDGRCPYGFECIDDRCVRTGDDNGTAGECTVPSDCSCEHGALPACGEDERCWCITFQGRLDGVGPIETGGVFGLAGGRLGPANCVAGEESAFMLCGGITQ